MTGKTLILRGVSTVDTLEILARGSCPSSRGAQRLARDDCARPLDMTLLPSSTIPMMHWIEEHRDGLVVFRPEDTPSSTVVAFSGRGHAPETEPTPTPFLARRV